MDAMKPAVPGAVPKVLAVWPVRHVVVFPYAIQVVRDTRSDCLEAIAKAVESEHRLCMFAAQRTPDDERPDPDSLYRVGTVAMIMRTGRLPGGGLRVMVQGLRRARIQRLTVDASGYQARVDLIEERAPSRSTEVADLVRSVRAKVQKLWAQTPPADPGMSLYLQQAEDPGPIADIVVPSLDLDVADGQALLELDDPMERLRRVGDRLDEALDPAASLDTVARLEKLERIYEAQFPGNDPEKIAAFMTAAQTYRRMRMPAQAVPLYEKVLAIRRATETQPSRAIVETMGELSMVLAVVGKHQEAMAPLNEMVAILKKHFPTEQAALYSALNNLAGCARCLGRDAEAEQSWLEILQLAESGFAARRESVAATYHQLASLYVTTKDYKRAEDAFSRALSLKRQIFGDGHPEVGLTLYNLAYLYEQLGQAEKGAATRAEAIRLLGRDPLGD
jgi:tetratricopeptide (TPR) repeat protein